MINQNEQLGLEMMTNSLILPSLLIKHYNLVGLTDVELLVLLKILSINKDDIDNHEYLLRLPEAMSSERAEIKNSVASLMEKGLLTINAEPRMDMLYKLLEDIWEKENAQGDEGQLSAKVADSLFTIFEQEFGRLLTPMEASQINMWLTEDKYNYDIIKEALKRSVLRGVLNFKYVDSILREWAKKNFKTVKEIKAYEASYGNKRTGKSAKEPKRDSLDDKYNDIYMT
ncbi:DNA replication protein [Desulfitispora alkaliphila]|uniref:DnaD domain-containing protein n=1 Tax=Desulfitispora alkaliphila TaxID=622674 RepID=UPI003D1AD4A6